MEFQYHLPVNLLFGRGKVATVGTAAAKYGTQALIVTGGSSSKKSGLLDRVRQALEDAGVSSIVFDQVTQNPLTKTAELGAKIAKMYQCNCVIGLGGGSIMDCAKAIAFLAVNDGDINDYIYNRLAGEAALPIIAIPTTCGTGSEGNGFSVLTNPENGDKKSLRRDSIIPALSIIDSELMQTIPKRVLSSVCFDALCHSMEAYLSRLSQPMTESLSLQGMKLIAENLVEVCNGSQDPEQWDAVTWASTIGGMVIHTAGVALPHGMEHPASGLKNIVHGRGLAALTPVITDASFAAAPEKYEVIAKILGGKTAADCGDSIRNLLQRIDLTTTLSEQGICEEDIPWMTENCFKVSAASINNHPTAFDRDGIAKLYELAL
jgi:alcohol dehydrogenase class IV